MNTKLVKILTFGIILILALSATVWVVFFREKSFSAVSCNNSPKPEAGKEISKNQANQQYNPLLHHNLPFTGHKLDQLRQKAPKITNNEAKPILSQSVSSEISLQPKEVIKTPNDIIIEHQSESETESETEKEQVEVNELEVLVAEDKKDAKTKNELLDEIRPVKKTGIQLAAMEPITTPLATEPLIASPPETKKKPQKQPGLWAQFASSEKPATSAEPTRRSTSTKPSRISDAREVRTIDLTQENVSFDSRSMLQQKRFTLTTENEKKKGKLQEFGPQMHMEFTFDPLEISPPKATRTASNDPSLSSTVIQPTEIEAQSNQGTNSSDSSHSVLVGEEHFVCQRNSDSIPETNSGAGVVDEKAQDQSSMTLTESSPLSIDPTSSMTSSSSSVHAKQKEPSKFSLASMTSKKVSTGPAVAD